MSRLDCAIPAQSAGGVRIVTTEVGIPGTGNAIVCVAPTYGPAVNGSSAIVGNTDGALKAGIPLIVECVRADRCMGLTRGDHAQA